MILFSLFSLYYLYLLLSRTLIHISLLNLIKELNSQIDHVIKKHTETRSINERDLYGIIQLMPRINDHLHLSCFFNDLSYNKTAIENFKIALNLKNQLRTASDYSSNNLKKIFNPIYVFKKFIQLPSQFIGLLGFKLNNRGKALSNLLLPILIFFLNLYSQEIKIIISKLMQLIQQLFP